MPGYRKTRNVDMDKVAMPPKKTGMAKNTHADSKEGKIARIVSGLKKMNGDKA